MAVPDPSQVAPWYLRNITQALELDEATGNVFVRTNAQVAIADVGNLVISNVGINSLGNVNITGNTMPVTIVGNLAGITGNIGGITSNVTIVDGGGSITVDGTVNANITGGNVSTTIGGTNLDAFGRLRVSEPYTLFDSQNLYIDGDQFSNITANSGSVTYVPAESSFNLAVTTANGSSVIRQTRTTQAYQPGKSLLTMNTFAMAELTAGCRQRIGYFTSANGVYFEADGTDLYLVIRSSASGALVEERIAQADWNTNTLKSATSPNPSGYI
jgi:hypothetical protein